MAIEKLLRWTVIVGIFALPFIIFIVADGFQRSDLILFPFYPLNADNFFFPFITGKNFAFRIIVEIITGAWLALALIKPEYRPKKSWLLGAFAIFTIIIALADATGVNPFKSFWSNYERMDGWVTLAHLFLYFVVAAAMLNTEKLWKSLLQTMLIASLLISLYGYLQFFGVLTLTAGFESVQRIAATFGNPIYLGVYMLFHVFIAGMLLSQNYADGKRSSSPSLILYIAIIVLVTIMLFFTGTRGAILGLIGGALTALFLFALSSGSKAAWRVVIAALVGVILLGGGLGLGK